MRKKAAVESSYGHEEQTFQVFQDSKKLRRGSAYRKTHSTAFAGIIEASGRSVSGQAGSYIGRLGRDYRRTFCPDGQSGFF